MKQAKTPAPLPGQIRVLNSSPEARTEFKTRVQPALHLKRVIYFSHLFLSLPLLLPSFSKPDFFSLFSPISIDILFLLQFENRLRQTFYRSEYSWKNSSIHRFGRNFEGNFYFSI
jgi:hypothetical protein